MYGQLFSCVSFFFVCSKETYELENAWIRISISGPGQFVDLTLNKVHTSGCLYRFNSILRQKQKNALCGEVFTSVILDALRAYPKTYKLCRDNTGASDCWRVSTGSASTNFQVRDGHITLMLLEITWKKFMTTKWTITGNKHEWPNDQVLVIWTEQGKRTWTLERSRVVR